MTWEESLWKNYTDGIIILHKGKVVYERYFSELTETDVHAVMSLTKAFNGTLASILVAEGTLDEITDEEIVIIEGNSHGK